MAKSELGIILASLSLKELREFDKYVHSDLFLKRKNVAHLLDVIKKLYPDFEGDSITRKYIFKRIFPERKYSDVLLRKLYSDLLKMSKDFLAYINFRDAPFFVQWHLANELNFRGINTKKVFTNTINKALSLLEHESRRDEEYYLYKFLIEEERNLGFSDLKRNAMQRNWQESFSSLLTFSIMSLLNYYNFLGMQAKTKNIHYKILMQEELLSFLEHNPSFLHSNPIVAIYYFQLKAFLNEDDTSYFFQLKKMVYKHGYLFGKVFEANIYVGLYNFCSLQVEKGHEEFAEYRFEIVKKMSTKKLCYENGIGGRFLIPTQFSSYVLSAVETGKCKQAENFIHRHKEELYPPLKRNMINVCCSIVCIYKGEYEKALKYLSELSYDNFHDKMRVKVLMLMAYYELDLIEEAYSLIDTFKHFLSKYKLLSQYDKERHSNFVGVVQMLLKIKTGKTTLKKCNITEAMASSKRIVYRNWLSQKIKEMTD